LHGVCMEEDAALLAELSDDGYRLQRANLVVRRHHTYEDGLLGHYGGDLVAGDAAKSVHRQEGDPKAFPLKPPAWIKDSAVLRSYRDNVVALATVHRDGALDGEVIAFSRAAGEDDLLVTGSDK